MCIRDRADDNPVVAAYVGGGNTSTGVAYTYDTKKKVSTPVSYTHLVSVFLFVKRCGSNLHKQYLRKHFFLSLMGIKKMRINGL